MILQSLVKYYEAISIQNKIAPLGWSSEKVGYAVCISNSGELENIISLKEDDGKKLVPRKMIVPEHGVTSSGIKPKFICDKSDYIFGVNNKSEKDNPDKEKRNRDRAERCFRESAAFHNELLAESSSDIAKAICNYYTNWNPDKFDSHPVVQNYKDDITSGINLIFMVNGSFAIDDDEIRCIWEKKRNRDLQSKEHIRCLITGEMDSIATIHPNIKGMRNAQSSGASLVSFNETAFCSYSKQQGENAQTGEYAANAYCAAINYLLSNRSYYQYIGDTAVLVYSLDAKEAYQSACLSFLFGNDGYYTEDELRNLVKQLCEGKCVNYQDELLDPEMEFFILGLAPNAARLSVRFFWANTFGAFLENIQRHQARLEINRGNDRSSTQTIPLWQLINQTYRDGGDPSPLIAGEILRSIISDTVYPATLINAIDLRIRADHKINDVRAAIIKAYYLKNENKDVPKEVLTVGLNRNADNKAYNLGRLFAILEKIQEAANPGINATIKDKFFGNASSIPATIFPILINLSQKHLRKIDGGLKVYYEKQLSEVMGKIDELPSILNMPQRGAFQLGYYHQIEDFYSGKEK